MLWQKKKLLPYPKMKFKGPIFCKPNMRKEKKVIMPDLICKTLFLTIHPV